MPATPNLLGVTDAGCDFAPCESVALACSGCNKRSATHVPNEPTEPISIDTNDKVTNGKRATGAAGAATCARRSGVAGLGRVTDSTRNDATGSARCVDSTVTAGGSARPPAASDWGSLTSAESSASAPKATLGVSSALACGDVSSCPPVLRLAISPGLSPARVAVGNSMGGGKNRNVMRRSPDTGFSCDCGSSCPS